jgi:UDP-N-acetylmuramoylalanine--D-glutamate ligase
VTEAAPLLVYGLGRSGGAVVARARRAGAAVLFLEARPDGDDVAAALSAGAERTLDVADALRRTPPPRTCVAAPGVPIDHPDLEAIRSAGVEVIGEVVWVLRDAPARTVGITGTAGKGTVTRWITDGLLAAGIDAVAGGNIVPALAAVARPGATLVIELSSFQLERAPGLCPDVAVVLNLGVDHLDRHRDVATYHAAKRSLLRELGPGQTFVGNADDPVVSSWLGASQARGRAFSVVGPADAWWDRGRGRLWLDDEPLLAAGDLRVVGEHQVANALAVALALDALGVPRATIAGALAAFRGLPGRYAEVGRLAEVRFIEDSIATRPLSVAAALRATEPPIVWIAGGVDKGADVEPLAGLVSERVTLMLGIGASGARLCERVGAWTRSERIDASDGREALRRAVRRAWEVLDAEHGAAGSVLLAPLAASFDQFRDYRDRGDAFRAAIAALVHDVGATESHAGAAPTEGVTWTPCS